MLKKSAAQCPASTNMKRATFRRVDFRKRYDCDLKKESALSIQLRFTAPNGMPTTFATWSAQFVPITGTGTRQYGNHAILSFIERVERFPSNSIWLRTRRPSP